MTTSDRLTSTGDTPGTSHQEIFQQQWLIYRTMVDHNYLYHRDAASCLRQILLDSAPPSFRFLDLACGDASEITECSWACRSAGTMG